MSHSGTVPAAVASLTKGHLATVIAIDGEAPKGSKSEDLPYTFNCPCSGLSNRHVLKDYRFIIDFNDRLRAYLEWIVISLLRSGYFIS